MSIARAALLARPRAASTFALQRRPASTDSHAADSHHHDEHHGEHDDIAYPKEGFTSSAWRVGILLSVAVVGWYKLAPAKGEDVTITRWLAQTSTPAEYWEKLNLQHLFLTQQAAQTFQIQADAKTPLGVDPSVPQIALFLSRSPLLSSPDQSVGSSGNNYFNSYAFNADDILATFLGPSRAPAAKQRNAAVDLSSLSSFPSSFASSSGSSGERLSSCGSSSCPLSSASGCSSEEVDKPLPHIPVTATAKEIIALLDLLDRFDADVANEVERVKEGIRDVRDLVGAYTRERRVREGEARKIRAREKRETKGIDSDFWLGL